MLVPLIVQAVIIQIKPTGIVSNAIVVAVNALDLQIKIVQSALRE